MTGNAPEQWTVVVNGEYRYALLPEGIPVPAGWKATGFSGTEQACIARVDTITAVSRPEQ